MPSVKPAAKGASQHLTSRRERSFVENKEFAAMAQRIVKAFSRRVASGDVEALPDLIVFTAALDAAIGEAVTGLREFGYTWPEIAARAGISAVQAQERWGTTQSKLPKQIRRALEQDSLPGLGGEQ